MILIRDTRTTSRIPTPYQPPPIIAAGHDRFFAQTDPHGDHLLWTGAHSGHRRPLFTVRGTRFYIHDFAYQALLGELWPHLRAHPACGHPLCVAKGCLLLERAGRRPHSPLEEADWDVLAELLYDRSERAAHRHLPDEYAVGEVYGEPQAWYELRRRNARFRHQTEGASSSSITFDAPRIAVG